MIKNCKLNTSNKPQGKYLNTYLYFKKNMFRVSNYKYPTWM